MLPIPRKFSLAAGAGEGKTELNAFDAALLASGLGNLNLLKISSILPPGAVYFEKCEIAPGSLVPTAFGAISSDVPGELLAAAVAVGIPAENTFGVIMESSDKCSAEVMEARITEMVKEAFAMREMALKEIKVCATEHRVVSCGSAFAGVALWY